jgi:uncharacterized membrane protein YjgN (DUF898 family)
VISPSSSSPLPGLAPGIIRLPGSALPPGAGDEPIRFFARAPVFMRLIVRGAFLQLVTFGFYRFWLTTDVRRHLWSHTSIAGDAFEYAGRGRELLIGFLLALAVLSPIYLGYFILGIELERVRSFLSLPLFGLYFVLAQFAIYRARRYRLTRTIWRGVRFWMTGSGVNYALRSSLWMLLVIVTLGGAYPWRATAIERYKMRHTRFGNLPGSFVATGGEFFRQAGWIWGLFFCPLVALGLGSLASVDAVGPGAKTALIVFAVVFGLAIPVLPFLWPVFRAIEWRWWANGLRVGGVRVVSDLGSSSILPLYLKFVFFAVCIVVVGGTIITIAIAALASGFMVPMANAGKSVSLTDIRLTVLDIGATAGAALTYLIAFLAIGVVQRFYLQHELWRVIAQSLRLDNLDAAADVVAEGAPVGALGEGLADSLDVAGF